MPSISELGDYIQRHPPFDSLGSDELERVAAAAESEFHPAGTAILKSADATSESAYLVRSGSVELLAGGRVVDMLGEGELFGFAALLDEGPTGFVARAAEDTLVLRFPAAAIRPVLERPAAVPFLARAVTHGVQLIAGQERGAPAAVGGRRVGDLVRKTPVLCDPGTTVQSAAARMVDGGVTCVVVDLGDSFGIVTDRDMRTVVAEGAGPDTPLSAVMTAPAWTMSADRTETEALLEMLDHGVRHLPVLEADRRLVGVIDDLDLMASERRAPFRLRARIAESDTEADVAHAAAELPGVVVSLHETGVPAALISRTISSIHDTITRRLIELAEADLGTPHARYTWLAMGSFGRREPFPSSDVDCALAYEGEPGEDLDAIAARVLDGLQACGFKLDRQGAVASNPLFARSVSEWQEAARAWVEDPDATRGLILLSVVVESDPVWGTAAISERLAQAFLGSPGLDAFLRRLAAAALAERPPTGFLRDFVLHSSGERRGVLDIKKGGMVPIESLARWSGLAAGVTAASTSARISAAAEAGTLSRDDAAILRDAFELCSAVRMEHQAGQLRAGEQPDDLIAPRDLAPLTRTALKEAFRAVARVQRGIASAHGFSAR